MRTAILFLLSICCASFAVAQNQRADQERLDFMNQLLKAASQRPNCMRGSANRRPEPIRLPANFLPSSVIINETHTKKPLKIQSTRKLKGTTPKNARVTALCKDTSYRRLIGIFNSVLFMQSVSSTKDGGMLVSVTVIDTTRPQNLVQKQEGALFKLDETGTVLWLKQFENLKEGPILSYYNGDRAYELSNGDIMVTGLMDTSNVQDSYMTTLLRLSSTGNQIWRTEFKTNIGFVGNVPGTFSFYIESATEGMNGDLILCGTSNANYNSGIATVLRINSTGQIVWDANYGNHGDDGYRFGMEGLNAFVENGQIMM